MERQVIRHELEEVIFRVWERMLGRSANLENGSNGSLQIDEGIAVKIGIHGAWNGTCVLCASLPAADCFASAIFCLEKGSKPSSEQAAESLKELTNIIAGNMKTVLPEPSTLTVPEFLGEHKPNDDEAMLQVFFSTEGNLFQFSVFKDAVRAS